MLGWPNHPIGGGWPPRLAWGGSATPRPVIWGRPNHPQWPTGWFGRPLGQTLKFFFFWVFGPRGNRTTPWGYWGWFSCPQTGWPKGGQTTPGQMGWPVTTYGVVQPPSTFKKKKKKCDWGILGINRLNGLNCHNLKVWGGKVPHFKLLR